MSRQSILSAQLAVWVMIQAGNMQRAGAAIMAQRKTKVSATPVKKKKKKK